MVGGVERIANVTLMLTLLVLWMKFTTSTEGKFCSIQLQSLIFECWIYDSSLGCPLINVGLMINFASP